MGVATHGRSAFGNTPVQYRTATCGRVTAIAGSRLATTYIESGHMVDAARAEGVPDEAMQHCRAGWFAYPVRDRTGDEHERPSEDGRRAA